MFEEEAEKFGIELKQELVELWSLTEEWIDEAKAKTNRASCRIGTTIQMKNDQKKVDETWELIHGEDGLEELALELHNESGLLELAIARHNK